MIACAIHQPWMHVSKASKSQQDQIDALLRQQSGIEDNVRRSFVRSIAQIQNNLELDRIAREIQNGRFQSALNIANEALTAEGYSALASTVSNGLLALTTTVSEAVPTAWSFGPANPNAVAYANEYRMDLIQGVRGRALETVRSIIARGVEAGQSPIGIASNIRRYIGLTARQVQAIDNYRSYLENLDIQALHRALRDRRFDRTIRNAIDNDDLLSSEKIDRMVQRYYERSLKLRAETIARTETARALSAGSHRTWKQAVADGVVSADRIKRIWIYTHDPITRFSHRTIPLLNPNGVGLDEPFKSVLGTIMYPGDPNADPANSINCRCSVFYRLASA